MSKTNYEAYKRKQKPSRTVGLFQNDPERQRVVKHPGNLQLINQADLLRVNPEIKAYLEKK
jgi:hypothetical protein